MGLMLIAGILFFIPPVFAQDNLPPECRLLPVHVPRADVSANYRAGVVVHGKAVVPADLNGGHFPNLDHVVIPLSVDLAERLNNSNIQGLQLEAGLGTIEIYQSGRVVYNGQDWTSQVYAICGENYVPESVPSNDEGMVVPQRKPKTDAVEVMPVEAVPPSGN